LRALDNIVPFVQEIEKHHIPTVIRGSLPLSRKNEYQLKGFLVYLELENKKQVDCNYIYFCYQNANLSSTKSLLFSFFFFFKFRGQIFGGNLMLRQDEERTFSLVTLYTFVPTKQHSSSLVRVFFWRSIGRGNFAGKLYKDFIQSYQAFPMSFSHWLNSRLKYFVFTHKIYFCL
jgi:hypothetical protein